MIYYKNFKKADYIPKNHGHNDNTIFTFDIETTSYLILDGKQLETSEYLKMNNEDRERVEFRTCMYIWQFSINDKVFYGRQWDEFIEFLDEINEINPKKKKYIFVHNLSFEFSYLKSILNFTNIMARKSHRVIKAESGSFEWRCSYYMSNCALKELPKMYNLNVTKKVGDLDYTKIRTPETPLSKKELEYCECDCLVVYEYIKMELEQYEDIWRIPLTSTGHVRKDFKDRVKNNWDYRKKIRRAINTDPHVYNLLQDAMAGGYVHSNVFYSGIMLQNITSYDITSAYPFYMLAYRYPSTKFTKCTITDINELNNRFAYLIHIKFYDLKSKYFNYFLSRLKPYAISNGRYDNGRIISADYVEITITDVDLKTIILSYDFSRYEILECYYSLYDYLPKELLSFILEKYQKKTQYKGVKGCEMIYQKNKQLFNSIFGMMITNTIRDDVTLDAESTTWKETPLTNEEIEKKLKYEEVQAYLSYAHGCWITAYRSISYQLSN